jgi:hypothetical protein
LQQAWLDARLLGGVVVVITTFVAVVLPQA